MSAKSTANINAVNLSLIFDVLAVILLILRFVKRKSSAPIPFPGFAARTVEYSKAG